MKVLTIKNPAGYFRFTQDTYRISTLESASVFAVEEIASVRQKLAFLNECGEKHCQIYLLTITEEIYDEYETADPARP